MLIYYQNLGTFGMFLPPAPLSHATTPWILISKKIRKCKILAFKLEAIDQASESEDGGKKLYLEQS
jgi:hypothetical protein